MGLTPCSITQSHHRTSFLGDTTSSKARWNYLSGSVCRNLQWSIAAVGTTVPQSAVQQMLLVLTLPHLTQRQPNLLCGGQGCCHPQNPRGPAWCYFASLVFCVWMLMGWYNHEPVHPGFASRATRLGQPFAGQGHPKSPARCPAWGCLLGKERVVVWQQTWTQGWIEQGRKRLLGSSKTVQQVAHGHAWHRRGCHHVAKAFYSLPSCFAYFCVKSFLPSAPFQYWVAHGSPWQLLEDVCYRRVLSK